MDKKFDMSKVTRRKVRVTFKPEAKYVFYKYFSKEIPVEKELDFALRGITLNELKDFINIEFI